MDGIAQIQKVMRKDLEKLDLDFAGRDVDGIVLFGKSWPKCLSSGKCFEIPIKRICTVDYHNNKIVFCEKNFKEATFMVREVTGFTINKDYGLDCYNSYIHIKGYNNLINYLTKFKEIAKLTEYAVNLIDKT